LKPAPTQSQEIRDGAAPPLVVEVAGGAGNSGGESHLRRSALKEKPEMRGNSNASKHESCHQRH